MHEIWLWIIQQKPIQIITEAVAICSVLHSFLPPWDWDPEFMKAGMAEFPALQKAFHAVFDNRWYRALIYVTGYIALNGRSTVWKIISVKNPGGPNANIPALVKGENRVEAVRQANL